MTSGSSTTPARTGAKPKTCPRRCRRSCTELQRLWVIEATRYKVLPLDDRMLEKLNPDTAGRPVLIKGKTQLLVRRHGTPLGELCPQRQEQVALRHRRDRGARKRRRGRYHRPGRKHRRLELLRQGRQAQVLLQLGRLSSTSRRVRSPYPRRRAPGAHGVRLRRRRPGQGRQGDACTSTARRSAKAKIGATLSIIFSADDGCDVGEDTGAPVSPDYGPAGNAFNGTVKGVSALDRRGGEPGPLGRPSRGNSYRDGAAVSRPIWVAATAGRHPKIASLGQPMLTRQKASERPQRQIVT